MTVSRDDIVRMLRDEGLIATEIPKANGWEVPFIVDGEGEQVLLMHVEQSEYLAIVSLIAPRSLDTLDAEELRELIIVASRVSLAKLEYVTAGDFKGIFATSECATESVTGGKIRRRLEACARLAHDARKSLDRISKERGRGPTLTEDPD
jgi:hypothetical protein